MDEKERRDGLSNWGSVFSQQGGRGELRGLKGRGKGCLQVDAGRRG